VGRGIGVVVIVHIDTTLLPDFTRRHVVLVMREISFRNKYLLNMILQITRFFKYMYLLSVS